MREPLDYTRACEVLNSWVEGDTTPPDLLGEALMLLCPEALVPQEEAFFWIVRRWNDTRLKASLLESHVRKMQRVLKESLEIIENLQSRQPVDDEMLEESIQNHKQSALRYLRADE